MTPFRLVYGRDVSTMLNAMLPHTSDNADDAEEFTQRAKQARQLARVRVRSQQRYDGSRYNLRRRQVNYQRGDMVWVWTPVRPCGLSEKLLRRYFGPYKVLRQLSDVTYEVVPNGAVLTSRRKPQTEIVHVVRMTLYYLR